MKVRITPAPIWGTIDAIASKSDAHRHLICAALATRPTLLRLATSSEDIEATVSCLRALGARIEEQEDALLVRPVNRARHNATFDCGESGSTLRFLLPVVAALTKCSHFVGRGRLPERPLGELVNALRCNGVSCTSEQVPLSMSGTLNYGDFSLSGSVSSQYISGLLLALPLLEDESEIFLSSPLESAAYVQITIEVMERYGVIIEPTSSGFVVPGRQSYRSPRTARIEGDWSNAAFFLAAGALGKRGASVTVSGLSLSSLQGDRRAVDFLKRFGAEVSTADECVTVTSRPLQGCCIDIGETPDLLPALAVVAACAEGSTHFSNAARLRLKESDRLAATAALLRSLGGAAEELPDGLVVHGGGLKGGIVSSFHDHRIAMAAAIAATACAEPVTIGDARAVGKSYPAFYTDFQKLGGIVDVI